jgi:hypothetical protein
LEESPPWFVSVILNRTPTELVGKRDERGEGKRTRRYAEVLEAARDEAELIETMCDVLDTALGRINMKERRKDKVQQKCAFWMLVLT